MNKKKKGSSVFVTIFLVAMILVAVFGLAFWGFKTSGWGLFSKGGQAGEDSIGEGPWSDSFVYFKLNAKNFYTSSAVNPSIELYSSEPASCWENPRESTCTETFVGSYTLVNGTKNVEDQKPGKYYAVARLSSYYSEYETLVIPNGEGHSESLSEYNQAPESISFNMKEADTLTIGENATVTISTNTTGKENTVTKSYTVSDDKCIQLWKYVVLESNYSLTDYGTQVSYDGMRDLKITIQGGTEDKIISLGSGITNGFSTDGANQQYEVDIEDRNLEICDGKSVEIKVYTKANTRMDGAGVINGDQLWDNNETIAKVLLYDRMGTRIPASGHIFVSGSDAIA